MTCQEVEELIDLFAADACDAEARDAVEGHLRECAACTARLDEAQRLQGLLDVHLNQGGVERLQQRINAEDKRRKKPFVAPFLRRASLVAAVVLIAFGLIWWLPKDQGVPSKPDFALLVRAGKSNVEIVPKMPAKLDFKNAEAIVVLTQVARGGESIRKKLTEALRNGELPLPTAVSLELTLVNNSKRAVEVRLGEPDAELSFEISDENVMRAPAPKAETPPPLRMQTLQMEPGKQLVLPIEHLVAGSPGKLEYLYLTEPGEWTLTPSLRLTADGQVVNVKGATMRIKVEHPRPESK